MCLYNIGRPIIISVSDDQTLYITSDIEKVVLICELTADNITAVYWERLNGSLPKHRNYSFFDANKAYLNITKAGPHISGDFQCVVHSLWGVTRSRTVSVLVKAAPPTIIRQPMNKTVNALENITFTCEAKGFHVRYEWRRYDDIDNFTIINNDSTLTLSEVTPSDEGEYDCVAMTGKNHHRAYSDRFTLTVNGNK